MPLSLKINIFAHKKKGSDSKGSSLGFPWRYRGRSRNRGGIPLTRHIKSEVGLDVEIKARILERVHPDTFVKVVYFHCEPKDSKKPKIAEPHEIAEVSWIPAKEVLDKFTSDVAPEIKKFILKYIDYDKE